MSSFNSVYSKIIFRRKISKNKNVTDKYISIFNIDPEEITGVEKYNTECDILIANNNIMFLKSSKSLLDLGYQLIEPKWLPPGRYENLQVILQKTTPTAYLNKILPLEQAIEYYTGNFQKSITHWEHDTAPREQSPPPINIVATKRKYDEIDDLDNFEI